MLSSPCSLHHLKMARTIEIFGICCDGNKKQHNYLIDEDERIGVNGSKPHGPNSVIAMLHHYFTTHSLGVTKHPLHSDNCVVQNKTATYWLLCMVHYN